MPTGVQSSGSSRLALATFTKFMRAYNALRRRLEPELTRLGVTPTQFGVLEALLHRGPLNQRDLSEKLLTSQGNLTTVLDNLERDGLVSRRPSREDRRQKLVSLTPAGDELIRRIFPLQAESVERELGRLSESEQEELGRLCRKLGLGE